MKRLTCSQYDFEKMVKEDFLYIDKTEYIWQMISSGSCGYFLARPRRFGKSLLLSTLKAVFEGKRELFKGLALYDKSYDWKQYPVIHLDLGNCQCNTAEELENRLQNKVANSAECLGVVLRGNDATIQFENLIFDSSKFAPPVVLIDEYDKPILGNIDSPHVDEILRKLKGFYSVVKTSFPLLRFFFLTGVSKFCHVSVFSDLNNLTDISMDARFATMLGYTQEEFEHYFAEYIAQTESQQELPHNEYLTEIKRWYDGFRFEENADTVYNPVSLASFFISGGKFKNFWFATGTPSFLIKLIKKAKFDFERTLNEPASELSFAAYDVDNLSVLPLLLQTGYLTIKSSFKEFGTTSYMLDFPNFEVKSAFDCYLLNAYTTVESESIQSYAKSLARFVRSGDVEGFHECLTALIASIPYELFIKEEKYFQTIIYLLFLLLGVYIEAEAHTNIGRIDAVAACGDWIYIFEFKLDKNENIAFDQIMSRKYYQKYQCRGKHVMLIGANFSYEARQLTGWKTKHLR